MLVYTRISLGNSGCLWEGNDGVKAQDSLSTIYPLNCLIFFYCVRMLRIKIFLKISWLNFLTVQFFWQHSWWEYYKCSDSSALWDCTGRLVIFSLTWSWFFELQSQSALWKKSGEASFYLYSRSSMNYICPFLKLETKWTFRLLGA